MPRIIIIISAELVVLLVDHGEPGELVPLELTQDVLPVGRGRGQVDGLLAEHLVKVLALPRIGLECGSKKRNQIETKTAKTKRNSRKTKKSCNLQQKR